MTNNTHDSTAENGNPENGNPEDDDNVSAGEQVLDEGHVTPSQDDFLDDNDQHGADGGSKGDAHAADERTDPGAPPAQGDPG